MDDMISSGESMIDTAKLLKQRLAKRVIVCTTFGLFTNGPKAFDEAYEKGFIDCVITTNLNYIPAEILDRPWYKQADLSRALASIINTFNHDAPLSEAMHPHYKIQKLARRYKSSEPYDYIGKIV